MLRNSNKIKYYETNNTYNILWSNLDLSKINTIPDKVYIDLNDSLQNYDEIIIIAGNSEKTRVVDITSTRIYLENITYTNNDYSTRYSRYSGNTPYIDNVVPDYVVYNYACDITNDSGSGPAFSGSIIGHVKYALNMFFVNPKRLCIYRAAPSAIPTPIQIIGIKRMILIEKKLNLLINNIPPIYILIIL